MNFLTAMTAPMTATSADTKALLLAMPGTLAAPASYEEPSGVEQRSDRIQIAGTSGHNSANV